MGGVVGEEQSCGGQWSRRLLESVNSLLVQTSLMYSSSDHGKTFSQAHIPAVGPDQFYVPMNMPKAGAFIQYKDGEGLVCDQVV